MALFALLCLLLLCLTLSSEPVAASALTAEEEAAIEQLQEEVQKLLEALDTEELEAYLATLPQYEGSDLKEMLASIVTGDFSLDYSSLWQSVLALVWEEGKVMLPAFAVILAVTLLCGILNSAKNGFLKSTMTDIIHFAAYLSVGAVLLSVLISVLQAGFSAIGSMQRQMQIIYPILLTLMAASGGAVSAGIYRPAVAFLSSAVCEMFTAVVLPTSVVVIVLTFVGSLSDEVRTSKLGDFFKSVNKWLLRSDSWASFSRCRASRRRSTTGSRCARQSISSRGRFPLWAAFYRAGSILCWRGARLSRMPSGRLPSFCCSAPSFVPCSCLRRFSSFYG